MLQPGTFDDDQQPPWDAPVRRPALHDEDEDGDGWLGPERRMLRAGQDLAGALMAFEYEAARYRDDPLACMAFERAMGSLSGISSQLEGELSRWRTAISLIENGAQIAPLDRFGRPWGWYLAPDQLLHLTEIARPGDPAYVPQLLTRIAEEQERTRAHREELAAVCGRPTKSGEACQQIPVFWPGRGRVAACSRHLSPEEKADLGDAWSAVQEKHSCPACMVPAGVPCDDTAPLQVLPNGEFPRARSFAGRMMHSVRLTLGVPVEA